MARVYGGRDEVASPATESSGVMGAIGRQRVGESEKIETAPTARAVGGTLAARWDPGGTLVGPWWDPLCDPRAVVPLAFLTFARLGSGRPGEHH